MTKTYKLSRGINEEQAEEIKKEVEGIKEVVSMEFSEDRKMLKIEADEAVYGDVMNKAVNICRRLAGGCELSYSFVSF